MVTKAIFIGIVAVIFLQRLFELRLSQRNDARIIAQGGRDHTSGIISNTMKLLQLSWFASMIAEVFWLDRSFMPTLAAFALSATVAGQYLRYLSMRALEWRWTIRIMTLPGVPVIDQGIYRYLRHPNYLGVIIETPAVPLIHGAYLTAILYTVANTFFFYMKIRAEEQALSEDNNYVSVFEGRPRFIPQEFMKRLNKKLKPNEIETL